MNSIYLLVVTVVVAVSAVGSSPAQLTPEEIARIQRGLLGGLLGGEGGLLGGLLGGEGGLLGGLLGGEGGLLGGLLGGEGGLLGGLLSGILDPVLGLVGEVLDTVLKLVNELVAGLSGAKTAEEKTGVFDRYELKELCPVCRRLPEPDQVKACEKYCRSKNYVYKASR